MQEKEYSVCMKGFYDMDEKLNESLEKLRKFIEGEGFKGYEPQDILNSFIPFEKMGSFIRFAVNQLSIRNPVNIRPFIGIKKDYNAKSMALLLKAYSILYKNEKKDEYLKTAEYLYNWLMDNYTRGYSGYCWNYNFSWQDRSFYIKRNEPNIVATAFAGFGLYEYYLIMRDEKIVDILKGIAGFMMNDLPRHEDQDGICFGYDTRHKSCVYNANMLGCQLMSIVYGLTGEKLYLEFAVKACDWTIARQKSDGRWNNRLYPDTGKEKEQIDFHQGFILDALNAFMKYTGMDDDKYKDALRMGMKFYKNKQFTESGMSLFRYPGVYPVDIHNQSQGIITFSRNNDIEFANRIAHWTIDNMYDEKRGFFYYRKHRFFTNKIPYIKRSSSWMLLALVCLKYHKDLEP